LEFNVPFQHKYGYIRDELQVRAAEVNTIQRNTNLYRAKDRIRIRDTEKYQCTSVKYQKFGNFYKLPGGIWLS